MRLAPTLPDHDHRLEIQLAFARTSEPPRDALRDHRIC